ncbi:MAG: imelysin family protein [bacterium]
MKTPWLILSLGLFAVGCSDDSGTVATSDFDDTVVIQNYVDSVMVPKYSLLATRAQALEAAVETFAADRTQANLEAAQQAWRDARQPWEQSETSLFGPVDVNGYDPAIDSWPLNLTDLNAVLASDVELTQAYFDGLDASIKGFHAVELKLFGADGMQTPDGLNPRELQYLRFAAADVAKTANLLADSWTAGQTPYAEVFRTAGEANNTSYPSRSAAAQEIVTGMITILDEVANGKISDPYNQRDQGLVESPYSFNSIRDFSDNIRGAKSAYMGDFDLASKNGRGLDEWIAERDPQLNDRVIQEFDAAIEAIEAIPAPFRDAILDDAGRAKIQSAIDAILVVKNTVESDVQPTVRGDR